MYQVGIVASSFDLLHAGHIDYLVHASNNCETLIVALNANPQSVEGKHKPIQSLFERYVQLSAVKFIDKIVPYESEEDLLLLLKMIPHDVRILGDDYASKDDWTGKDYEESRGIKTIFVSRDHSLSTTELRQRVFKEEMKNVTTSSL